MENTNEKQVASSEEALVFILTENKIEETISKEIAKHFGEFYNQATEWKNKAEALVVTSSDQVEEMKEAKKARLALVKVRTGIDKLRKSLNEDDKNRIDARNLLAKYLTSLVQPIEEHLLIQEEFAERENDIRVEKIKTERTELLKPFMSEDDILFYDLGNMPDEMFTKMLDNHKLASEARIQKEKEAKEKELLEERSSARFVQMLEIGFSSTSIEERYEHPRGHYIEIGEIEEMADDVWADHISYFKTAIEKAEEEEKNAAQIKADELAKENARLEAEKAELEKAEKALADKHTETLRRQNLVSALGILADYNALSEMEAQVFEDYFKVKKSEYDAEQNRLFIERKKKEFEESKAKKDLEEKQAAERAAKLAPDKDKIQLSIDQCVMPKLEFTSGSTEALYATILSKFDGFKKWANEQVTTLK